MFDQKFLNSSSTLVVTNGHLGVRSDHRPPLNSTITLIQATTRDSDQTLPQEENDSRELDADQYTRLSHVRKIIIVIILSYCAILGPISSTAILAAVPELARTFNTTGDIINASNALYLAFMGIAALFWGPLSQISGRRPVFITSSILFFLFTVATALAPNTESYFVFRICTAFQGTAFLVLGSATVGDIFEPMSRALPLGWVLSGTLTGPALGPFLGGVVATFRPWRYIFWLLAALNGFAAVLIIFFFPETIAHKSNAQLKGKTFLQQTKQLGSHICPIRIARLVFSYPNIFLASLAAGTLVWNQYALLTPIRYVLNPRFHLTTPVQASLFYLAPGCGYLAGAFVGGRWADLVARKYAKIRGQRIPEDRLRSCVPFICIATPACVLIYGWTVDREVGGVPVPVISMFLQAVATMFCFPSLNTYGLDVMQESGRSEEVVAANFVFRYVFAALGTGVVLPAVQAMGVGWFSTISALLLTAVGFAVFLIAEYGHQWREAVDAKLQAKAKAKGEKKTPEQV
ncbi:putative MFS transporter [Aspergillus ibericus CBS 121593]|uniref:MFS general substrate transporter n=1 Tax=Aspergillus ibericus CBS 121593 TaxID=1448316 RepID=A0A395H2T6_9EURO|nr:MFS general substrate transporter [Aspergillus ibericus CBS 121593]RAL01719.1 MFS general substrate transporter [Aspergillus ibericus CBS 121593]